MVKEGNLAIAKWAGGKRQLLSQFEELGLFPKKFNNYYEPFVGAGSVMLYLKQNRKIKKIYISDVNEELINVYEIIRDNVEELIELLKRHKELHTKMGKKFYLEVRAENPYIMSKLSRATRFIYLNRTCFNGLYRVNSQGKFNVPMGDNKNPGICQEKDLRTISKLLKNVKVGTQSFEKVLDHAKKGDFVYFDPPYDPLKKSSFTKYAKDDFGEKEQRKLAKVFKELDKRGCYVMHSNNDTPLIRELYKKYITKKMYHGVYARRNINAKASGRGKIKEVVITNY